MPKNISNSRTWIALCLILLAAAALRFYGIGWGIPGSNQPRSYHPDEKMGPLVLSRMRPAEGEFNPRYFINPTLFYYQYGLLLAPVSRFTKITPPWQVKNYIAFTEHDSREQEIWFLTGRVMSVLMGVVTVWGVFWIGGLLAGRAVGLTAAAIIAIMPAHVIQSHYMVVDGPAVMWMVLSLAFFIYGLQRRRTLHFALSGLLLGFGTATKYTAVLVVLPQVVLAFQAALESARIGSREPKPAGIFGGLTGAVRSFASWSKTRWRWLLLWVSLAAVGFVVGCPYALIDWKTFLGAVGIGGLKSYNVFGFSLTRIFRVSFFYGLGLPMAVFVSAALALVTIRPAKRMFSLGVYLLASMLMLILNASPYMRHFVPFTPFLALCGGYLAVELYDNLQPRISLWAHRTVLVAGLLVFCYTTAYTLALVQAMSRKDPRTAAEQWLKENVEKYRVVAVIRPEWGEDFYSVSVDELTFSRLVTGFEFRLVEAFKPDFLVATEYELNNNLERDEEKDFKARLESSPDYAPVASFERRSSFFGLPIWYNPPGADWLYFRPNVVIYGRKTGVDSSRVFYLEARKAHEEKEYLQAEAAMVKSVKLDNKNPLHLYRLSLNRAIIFGQLVLEGKTETAIDMLMESQKVLDRALKIHPRAWMRIELLGLMAQLKIQEGLVRIKMDQLEKAQEICKVARVIKKQQKVVLDSLNNVSLSNWDQDYNNILVLLAESYYGSGKHREAEPVLIELLKRDPTQRKALINLGNIFLKDPKRHPQALKLFKRAQELYPDLKERGDISEVVKRLEQEQAGLYQP